MLKRKIAIFLCALCFCLRLIPFYAQAIGTEDAVEPIIPEKECALTMFYGCDGTAFADVTVKLYKIADVSADYQYTLTGKFAGSSLILNGIRTTGEWNAVRSTLEAYILAHSIQPDDTAITGGDGKVCFETLETGMYFAVVGQVAYGDIRCDFDSALVALPGLGTDGHWQYQVEVNAKPAMLPPVQPDEELQLHVLKLWKGDEGSINRPRSVEIEIFRDGISYETVTLSKENNWSYTWNVKNDGASWMVVERNIPEGYTMTLEQRETSFIVTNTLNVDVPPVNPPQTGDTFNLLLPIVLMSISGSMLVLLGMIGKRSEQ